MNAHQFDKSIGTHNGQLPAHVKGPETIFLPTVFSFIGHWPILWKSCYAMFFGHWHKQIYTSAHDKWRTCIPSLKAQTRTLIDLRCVLTYGIVIQSYNLHRPTMTDRLFIKWSSVITSVRQLHFPLRSNICYSWRQCPLLGSRLTVSVPEPKDFFFFCFLLRWDQYKQV